MNKIDWAPKAVRQLLRFPVDDQQTLRSGVETLADFPQCSNIKKLVDHRSQYRLRIGRFRIFFDFDGMAHIVHVEEVRRRDDNTY
ncbi:MAG: type II toxin-antitoxin system RelE/ParE family toxin [Clostridia bacterium]|nr:type II toxin-antitoxin system RelE/ParE family toxin [Spirochaetia bacterium]